MSKNIIIKLILVFSLLSIFLLSSCQKTGKAFSFQAGVEENIYNVLAISKINYDNGESGQFTFVGSDTVSSSIISAISNNLKFAHLNSHLVPTDGDLASGGDYFIFATVADTDVMNIVNSYSSLSPAAGEAIIELVQPDTGGVVLLVVASDESALENAINVLGHFSSYEALKSTKVKITGTTVEDIAVAKGTLSVTSTPTKATVYLDEKVVGTTPFEQKVDAGTYRLRVYLDGYVEHLEDVTVSANTKKEVSVILQEEKICIQIIVCASNDAGEQKTFGTECAALDAGYKTIVESGRGCHVKWCKETATGTESADYYEGSDTTDTVISENYCDGNTLVTYSCVDDASLESRTVCEYGCDAATVSCKEAPAPSCGDGVCNGDENKATCPADCGACPAYGDIVCAEGTEVVQPSGTDENGCPLPPECKPVSCGDGVCNGDENKATCPADCGACPAYGDIVCAEGETLKVTGKDADGCDEYVCEAQPPLATKGTLTITGLVSGAHITIHYNTQDTPIVDETVTAESASWELEAGTYTILVTATGYRNYLSEGITLAEGEEVTHTVTLSSYVCSASDWNCGSTWDVDPTDELGNTINTITETTVSATTVEELKASCVYNELLSLPESGLCVVKDNANSQTCAEGLEGKPVESYRCVPDCYEKWEASPAEDCRPDGKQKITWTDANACGTEHIKPAETEQECTFIPTKGTLKVKAFAGATVTLTKGTFVEVKQPQKADSDNKVEFVFTDLEAGDYEVKAVMTGYKPAVTKASVTAGETTEIEVEFKAFVNTIFKKIKDKKLFDAFIIVIGADAAAADNIGALDIASGHRISRTVLDTSNIDFVNSNLILIGGPCANRETARSLLGSRWETAPPTTCAEGFEAGKAFVQVIQEGKTTKIIVAGARALDTRRIAKLLKNFNKFFAKLWKPKIEICSAESSLDIDDSKVKFGEECEGFSLAPEVPAERGSPPPPPPPPPPPLR